jgi:uncharacterized protein (DUF3084 family)
MSPEAQFILAIVGLLVGGGFATLLYTLTQAILKTQSQQGSQQIEWKAIVEQKDKQLTTSITEKDRQITRLEAIIAIRDERIEALERRISEVETRATRAELKVELLQQRVEGHD